MKKPAKILISVLTTALIFGISFSALPQTAKAAVPTFDVGLNPKMDILLNQMDTVIGQMNLLLCMIAGMHQKEVGPPPTPTCSIAGLGGNGGATGPGSSSGLGGLLGGLAGNILGGSLGGPIGSIVGKIGSVFGSQLGGQLGSIFPEGIFSFLPGETGGIPDITTLPSMGSVIGGVAGIFGACDSLDCIAWNISKAMLSMFSKEVVRWIETAGVTNAGITGTPLFVRDWDRYLLDAANAASNVFLRELQSTELCEPFGTELKKILNVGGGFSLGAISGGGLGAGIYAGSGGAPPLNQLLNCNLHSVTSNFQPFFDDFENGGGWQAWLDLSQTEINPYAQYEILAEEKEIREGRAVNAAANEAKSSDGFLGVKQCAETSFDVFNFDFDSDTDSLPLQDCPIVTPGILVEEEMAKVLGAEVDQLNQADELDEILSVLLQQLLQGVLFSAGGLFSPTYSNTPTDPSPIPLSPPQPPAPPPSGQPGIAVSFPADGGYVTGMIQATAMSTGFASIVSVQFSLDGVNFGAPVAGSGSFQIPIDTSTLTEGAHTIMATALNASSTQIAQSSSNTFTVDRTMPIISGISSNDNPSNIRGNVTFRVDASDSGNRRNLNVEFFVGGISIGQGSFRNSRYELQWNSRNFLNGTYSLTATVTDRAGNSVTSAPLTIIINN